MQKAEAQHNQMQNQPAVRQGKGMAFDAPQGEQIAQLEAMAESSPQMGKQAQLAAMVDGSPAMAAQRKVISVIHNSPNLTVQRQQLDSLTGETAQSAQAPALPSTPIQLSGREGDEWGQGPGQGESAPPTPRPVKGGQTPPPLPESGSQIQDGYSPRAGEERDETAQLMVARESSQLKVAQCADAPVKPNNTGLPDNLKSGIESLSGMSMDSVRVHYNSLQPAQLNALAYAQGTNIHVAPGQEKHLPHEAWHVVQQAQGRVKPTMQMKGGVPVNDDAGLEREADVMGAKAIQMVAVPPPKGEGEMIPTDISSVIQGAFAGAPIMKPHNPVATIYGGHVFTTGGTRPNTGCGTDNFIRTAGERKNSGSSQPGTPSNMTAYRYSFSRAGGLVRDPALNQSSTRIHLINHRLENSGNTQGVASNILLGSKNANNPTHLHNVENHVIDALHNYASKNNAAYQTALANSQTLNDADNGGAVTFWPRAYNLLPAALPVIHRINGWLDGNGDVTRTPSPSAGTKKATPTSTPVPVPDGVFVEPSNMFLPRHLWLEYRVTANYSGAPGFVQNNINHERAQNGGALAPVDPAIENTIQDFETAWKDDAFPANFTSNATYYIASYLPTHPYHQVVEAPETIQGDA